MSVVLDSSAVTAVVLGESDADFIVDVLVRHAGELFIGAPTRVECGIVAEARRGPPARPGSRSSWRNVGVQTVALDSDGALLALAAWRRFGKGRHPAALNLGDCFSYAVAKSLSMPLLLEGEGFAQTDITAAR